MPIFVLSESWENLPSSASSRDLQTATEAARLAGCRVYAIPFDFADCDGADAALAHIPPQETPTPAIWIGYIPSPERYRELYQATLARNLYLINTPEEHANAQEFDRAYPFLSSLTPESAVVSASAEIPSVVACLGLPLFVKGAVQSRKSRGWKACVVYTEEEAIQRANELLSLENRSRGRVIFRRLVTFRHRRTAPGGDFPLGREFRAFLLRGEILALGYYWEGEDLLMHLSHEEEIIVRSLAEEAARRVGTPYIAVDIGQDEEGRWWVIETGDAQFSGRSQINPLALWNRLYQSLQP